MRSKQRLLLLITLFFLCIHQLSATSLGRVEKMNEIDEELKWKSGAHVNKLSHRSVGGGGNGGSPVVSGGNGDSHIPSGSGVMPLYAAAGAGNNHHPHRGGGNCDRGGAGPEALALIAFACFYYVLINQYD